jgi:hypothetical protein
MLPLTLDDLLPLHEFAPRRREFLESLNRYLDRHRRVRIGPQVTLLFENRQTLWFRVQDLLRVARLSDQMRVQEELNLYNRLLPGRDHLQAALLLEISDESRLSEELEFWQTLQDGELRLRLGEYHYPARLVTCRPEDRAIGAAHWVHFQIDGTARQVLADDRQAAWLEIDHATYRHESPTLSEDVRQSLLDDLKLSERDG